MAKKKAQLADIFEFDDADEYETEWRGMPEFNQPDNGAFRQIIISFDDQAGVDAFARAINQTLTPKTKSVWYPPRPTNKVFDLFIFDEQNAPAEGKEEDGTA
jgi:hypothetical protein